MILHGYHVGKSEVAGTGTLGRWDAGTLGQLGHWDNWATGTTGTIDTRVAVLH